MYVRSTVTKGGKAPLLLCNVVYQVYTYCTAVTPLAGNLQQQHLSIDTVVRRRGGVQVWYIPYIHYGMYGIYFTFVPSNLQYCTVHTAHSSSIC